MIVIGLTGSIAMGKSTAAKMLVDMRGVVVHDSDAAVHRLYNDPEVIDRVREFFPKSYDSKTGKIDKLKLREELGTDHEKWDTIEDILHPYVRASQQQFLQEQQRLGTRLVILDIPLLFETGAEERVDYTTRLCWRRRHRRHRPHREVTSSNSVGLRSNLRFLRPS